MGECLSLTFPFWLETQIGRESVEERRSLRAMEFAFTRKGKRRSDYLGVSTESDGRRPVKPVTEGCFARRVLIGSKLEQGGVLIANLMRSDPRTVGGFLAILEAWRASEEGNKGGQPSSNGRPKEMTGRRDQKTTMES
ncbi:hypothetical protein U1Q18_017076 [Sarracenia purpurea var. burkii]